MSNHRYGLRTASGNIKDILQDDSLQVGRVLRSRTRINQGDVFFTDLYGNPTVAYSLRKLSASAINCIRVRRSNDNAEQDIGFINNKPNAPINTGQLLQFVGANNGFVTTWYDQSVSAVNVSQSTAADQPQIVSSGGLILKNTLPSIKFDKAGNGDFLQTTSNNHFQGLILDLYTVITVITYSQNGTMIWGSATSTAYWQLASIARAFVQGGTLIVSIDVNDGIQRLINMYIAGTNNKTITYNNSINYTKVETPTTISSANQVFILGRYGVGTPWNLDGEIQEFIVYGSNQSANRANIKTDINNYHNVF
jgi:hypothetical protein